MKLEATSEFTQEELQDAYNCILESFGCATPLDLDKPISQEIGQSMDKI